MGVTRSMHVKAHLLDSIPNVRTRQCEVLKRTDDGAVASDAGEPSTADTLAFVSTGMEAGL